MNSSNEARENNSSPELKRREKQLDAVIFGIQRRHKENQHFLFREYLLLSQEKPKIVFKSSCALVLN